MASINDIAEKAGVAKSTVSNVLSGKRYVSEPIREKVLKVCKEFNYSPNFYASVLGNVNDIKTNIIGIFLETSTRRYHTFYNDVIRTIVTYWSDYDVDVLLYFGPEEKEVADKLKKGQSPIDGAILVGPTLMDTRISEMELNSIPFVVIGSTDSDKITCVDTDNEALCEYIAGKMIDNGGDKICLINSNKSLTISKDREKGFNKAINEKNPLLHASFYTENSSVEEGFYHASLSLEKGYNAFIVGSSIIAKGVYQAIKSKNLVVGKDVFVFALGSSKKDLDSFDVSLSYAEQDYDQLALQASIQLREIMNDGSPNNVLIRSKLHINDSFKFEE